MGMPVSSSMIEHVALQPGYDVLELGAGPGDTGFLAAELVGASGKLICSDASEKMLGIARRRAQEQGITNVEFRRLELEWSDVETASVDVVLCRWAVMLVLDPAASLQETRRVLRPGGRLALAVWDVPEHNPWAVIPGRALIELGHAQPPEPGAPGMFALADAAYLESMLSQAGFVEVLIEAVDLSRMHASFEAYFEETLDLSQPFARTFASLGEAEQAEVKQIVAALVRPFVEDDGSLRFAGSSLVAAATA